MRLDALQLLCEHHKTTAAVSVAHLRLVQFFLQFNMDCQSPGFRQVLAAQLKKVGNSVILVVVFQFQFQLKFLIT